jgi:hypothetical protein
MFYARPQPAMPPKSYGPGSRPVNYQQPDHSPG